MGDTEEHEQQFSDEGTPWGSPAGALRRLIRRHRSNGTNSDSDEGSNSDDE